jgi:hypothetical protein
MSKRDEYVEKMKHHLDGLNAQFKKLEAKGHAEQADFRVKHAKQIAELNAHYDAGLVKMDEIKSASKDKWESLVVEGDKTQEAFKHSYHYFKSQMKKS